MKRTAVLGAVVWGVAQVASASPMKAFDAATGQPVVVTITPMSDAEAGITAADKPGFKSKAAAFEITAPGYEPLVIFQTRENLAGLSERSVQLCRTGAVDTDGDTLCDDAELAYGTNPLLADTDGDFMSDRAEILGWDGVDLASEGVRPAALDVRLEIDFYPGFEPVQAGIANVVEAFRKAPRRNADGSMGINLIVDIDDRIAPADAKPNLQPVFQDLAVLERKYRGNKGLGFWMVLANSYGNTSSSGLARGIPGDASIVTLGRFAPARQRGLIEQSGTIMHELGHNVNLRHGLDTNDTFRLNFLSVMSYSYQLRGLERDGVPGVLDYQGIAIGPVNEAALNEVTGLRPGPGTTEQELARYRIRGRRMAFNGRANQNIDFNGDGRISPSVAVDTDADGQLDSFGPTINEWQGRLRLDGGGTIGRGQPGMEPLLAAAMAQGAIPAEQMEPCMSEADEN